VNRERILRRLEEIERRVTKTTPGPWRLAGHVVEPLGSSQVIRCGDRIDVWNDESYANAEFIAHSREDMFWLRQLVRRLLAVAEAAETMANMPLTHAYEDEACIAQNRLRQVLTALEEEQYERKVGEDA